MIKLIVPLTENDVKMAMRRLVALRVAASEAGQLDEDANLYQSRCVLMSAMEVLSRDPGDLEWRIWLRDVHDTGAKQINLWLEDGQPQAIIVELPDGAPLPSASAEEYHLRESEGVADIDGTLNISVGPDNAKQYRGFWYYYHKCAVPDDINAVPLSLGSMERLFNFDGVDASVIHNWTHYHLQTAIDHLRPLPHGNINDLLLCVSDIMRALSCLLIHLKRDFYLEDGLTMHESRKVIAAHAAWIIYHKIMKEE